MRNFGVAKVIFYLILLLIFAWLIFYFFFRSNFFKIKDVEIEGSKTVSVEDLRQLIDKILEKNDNIWLFKIGEVEKEILRDHPDIEKVVFKRGLPSTIYVSLQERSPKILWQSGDNTYLVDNSGIAYEKSGPRTDLTKIIDKKEVAVKVGEKIITKDFVEFVNKVAAKFPQATGRKVKNFAVEETIFEVTAISERGERFIFDTTREAESQLGNLQRVLKKIGREKKIEYIDLRVEEWVYYK